ncbi:MAG: aminodeoxychorismate/anthranilate synthase component II [Caldiserica bacterium]|nr:MAG: aminodeoxychorismate/anthranilate synthase component II [Caldisericota bacterium]
MILVIDNYDSFVYNLVQYIGEFTKNIKVFRNDKISLKKVEEISPRFIVISPGPGRPEDAGISVSLVKRFYKKVPILGVCLGHQAIAYAFGGKIIKASRIMHGKVSSIYHYKEDIFKDVPSPFQATRYHSLIVSNKNFPKELMITAKTKENEIMGIKHKKYPLFGVQFHPESILTEYGKKIIRNFLNIQR